jgi:hypothetical protein
MESLITLSCPLFLFVRNGHQLSPPLARVYWTKTYVYTKTRPPYPLRPWRWRHHEPPKRLKSANNHTKDPRAESISIIIDRQTDRQTDIQMFTLSVCPSMFRASEPHTRKITHFLYRDVYSANVNYTYIMFDVPSSDGHVLRFVIKSPLDAISNMRQKPQSPCRRSVSTLSTFLPQGCLYTVWRIPRHSFDTQYLQFVKWLLTYEDLDVRDIQ